uniref:Restriction endonuclease n=1 Tax=viral metagenome TaxID=1070528 RepID=A0A6C0DZQ4_9ZZZZ
MSKNISKIDISWYKIPEIKIKVFITLIKPLYDIIEGKKIQKSEPDIFAQELWMALYNMTNEEWEKEHKKIQIERVWTMALGIFHQNIMGSFDNWENYKKGHKSGCDIGKIDGSCIAEIKNNINTMNSSSKESVLKKLKKQKELNKRTLLVIVNGDIKNYVKDGIEFISGRMFYNELSGRSNFMDDLLLTLTECFIHYKTYNALTDSLKKT